MVECLMEALCIKIIEVNISVFVYRLFNEDFSPYVGTGLDLFP